MRILIIEDNKDLVRLLKAACQRTKYDVDTASTLEDAQHVLETTTYAALVLDLGLPDGDGLVLLRRLREKGNPIPVLILTARNNVDDRVNGLKAGADDYLGKPFDLEEFLARLEALLRRPSDLLGAELVLGNVRLDTKSKQVTVQGVPRLLSGRETILLEILLRRAGRVVPKRALEDQIFGYAGEVSSNAVEVYIHRLRKQLAENGANIQIVVVRGLGYMIGQDA